MAIYRRGKIYWARWIEHGELKRRSLGTRDRRVAERRYEEMKAGRGGLKVRDILSRWFQYQKVRSKPGSISTYKVVRKRFSLAWGDLRPDEVTKIVVEEFQERALETGMNPRTANSQIGIALSALKWANERGLIDAAPPKYKRLKLNGRGRTRKYLTASELEKLLTTVKQPRWQRLEVVIMLALYAGLRQQEIIWLTWEDVDLADGWLHIRSKKGWSPKSSSSERSIPIAHRLEEFLAGPPRASRRWVAPGSPRGDRWCPRHLGRECRLLFRAAGVDDGGPHTLHRLRGTFATTVLRGAFARSWVTRSCP